MAGLGLGYLVSCSTLLQYTINNGWSDFDKIVSDDGGMDFGANVANLNTCNLVLKNWSYIGVHEYGQKCFD